MDSSPTRRSAIKEEPVTPQHRPDSNTPRRADTRAKAPPKVAVFSLRKLLNTPQSQARKRLDLDGHEQGFQKNFSLLGKDVDLNVLPSVRESQYPSLTTTEPVIIRDCASLERL